MENMCFFLKKQSQRPPIIDNKIQSHVAFLKKTQFKNETSLNQKNKNKIKAIKKNRAV